MLFKKLNLIPAFAIVFAITLMTTGCAKDDAEEMAGLCPIVVSTIPVDEAVNVPLDQVISATFNEELNPETLTSATYSVSGASELTGTLSYSEMTAFFTPAENLLPFTIYTGTVTTGIEDPMGNALQENYVWSFTTIPQLSLSVAPEASGTVSGAGLFDNESTVTAVAVPGEGFVFVNWTQADEVVSTNSTYEFQMNGNTALVANFEIATYALEVTAVNGSVSKTPDQVMYAHGTEVVLTATPDLGYEFSSWSVDASGSTNPLTVVMDSNKAITANFTLIPLIPYTLTVTAQNGTVDKNPNQATYDEGTDVILTPTPATGYEFSSWSGDATGTNNPLTVTMDADKAITANFTLIPVNTYTLTVTAQNGTVDKNPNEPAYDEGPDVILTPTPATGYEFSAWSGDATGTNNPLTVTMDADKAITANFTLIPVNTYTLTVNAQNGTVDKNPNEPAYDEGTDVILTPTPATGYEFSSWSGDATGTNNPLTVTMDADKTITANFTLIPVNTYTLTVNALNGTVDKSPNQATYNEGEDVILTATPDNGYEFSSWSGDATGTNNPLTVTMNADKAVTANFTQVNTGQICASPAVDLGLAGDYAMLAKSGISTTGNTSITGDLGISPNSSTAITGFGLILHSSGTYSTSSLVTGRVYASDYASPTPANLTTAVSNMETAFTTANGMAPDQTELLAGNINGQTLASGVYKWSSGLSVTNSITLDGGGVDCAKFVFQIAGDLTIADNTEIILINGAKADNIYWVVAGAGAVLGTDVNFSGNILSQTLISVNTRSTVLGRLLAQSAVTLDANAVVKPSN
ncbi:DUF3494 domain-containing protein [Psychroflexus sp. YR1-1]|uniref:DUF3494 domain-containing protein n=1 Tax=Psychroflexus aurantiacus TaxID=2709310 RepID=A0A6B3R7E3_9FLAO|nr:ice-binding family protein [Psychroflexus aurantiacus]NEV93434.1 DUF3494 domain-containing protein [Psychroflexus aurantiacus]